MLSFKTGPKSPTSFCKELSGNLALLSSTSMKLGTKYKEILETVIFQMILVSISLTKVLSNQTNVIFVFWGIKLAPQTKQVDNGCW